MSMIGLIQEVGYDVPTFTQEEMDKINNFKIPGENKDKGTNYGSILAPRLRGYGHIILEYQKDHKRRLYYLERAAGERY